MASSLILIAIAFTLGSFLESSAKMICNEVPTFSKIEDCPPKLTRDGSLKVYNDTCYQFHKTHKNAVEASKFCHDAGGYLVTIKSKEVNDFIQNWRRSSDGYDETMWIGLKDRSDNKNNRRYVWTDGASLEYKNVGLRHVVTSLSHMKKCVTMIKTTGDWEDEPCVKFGQLLRYNHPFMCEFRPEGITTTDPANNRDYKDLEITRSLESEFPSQGK